MALELKNIYKIYPNGYQAITDFNLEIKDKEFVVLVGPSGCGKSTTLRMIAGLEDITHGTFSIDGKVVNSLPPKNRGIAMVFQSYALYPTMTVYENLAFSLDLAGFDEDVIDARVKKTAAILGLGDYLDRQPRNLSGGQRQRVALGRAIIRHAKIFLMDEPLSNLDARQRVSMRSELIRIHRQVGATTIYVTHDQVEAMTMADRIVCMDVGIIKQVGTPEELYFHPKNLFVAGFIGDPPMNFISGSFTGPHFVTPDQSFDFDLTGLQPALLAKLANRKIVLGFRPEHAKFGPYASNPKYLPMHGQVEINEMLGDTQNVYLIKNGIKSIVKTPPEAVVSIGDQFSFFLDKTDLHFFDEETQDAIE